MLYLLTLLLIAMDVGFRAMVIRYRLAEDYEHLKV